MKTRVWLLAGITAALLPSCQQVSRDRQSTILVSVADQRMALFRKGKKVASYPVSTSKFGLGDSPGSNRTPVGSMRVVQKIGGGQPAGMVFRGRRPTGEVLRPNEPGRDPVVTRILRLTGTEESTQNVYGRYIYIHGTPEEWRIGTPASYGCIRMKSRDVIDLYNRIGVGAKVHVTTSPLPGSAMSKAANMASASKSKMFAKAAPPSRGQG